MAFVRSLDKWLCFHVLFLYLQTLTHILSHILPFSKHFYVYCFNINKPTLCNSNYPGFGDKQGKPRLREKLSCHNDKIKK